MTGIIARTLIWEVGVGLDLEAGAEVEAGVIKEGKCLAADPEPDHLPKQSSSGKETGNTRPVLQGAGVDRRKLKVRRESDECIELIKAGPDPDQSRHRKGNPG